MRDIDKAVGSTQAHIRPCSVNQSAFHFPPGIKKKKKSRQPPC